ncbi:hypothetical protein B0G81_2409 [Paraburkholderia sp. BL6665CI2N2]|nr:hypothetical protein B0G81_2409 [Paraburkholderia sp. BL6665CI2N2]
MAGDSENFVIFKICRLPSQVREISIPHHDGNFYKIGRQPSDADASGAPTDGLVYLGSTVRRAHCEFYRWSRFRRLGIANIR